MTKNLKLTIKNAQIANAVNLSGLKDKLANKKTATQEEKTAKEIEKAPTKSPAPKAAKSKTPEVAPEKEVKEEVTRVRARSRSAFAEPTASEKVKQQEDEEAAAAMQSVVEEVEEEIVEVNEPVVEQLDSPGESGRRKSSEELRKEIFAEEISIQQQEQLVPAKNPLLNIPSQEEIAEIKPSIQPAPSPAPVQQRPVQPSPAPRRDSQYKPAPRLQLPQRQAPREFAAPTQKLGPTGKHVNDLLPPPTQKRAETPPSAATAPAKHLETGASPLRQKAKGREGEVTAASTEDKRGPLKTGKLKEFQDIKPAVKRSEQTRFDARDKQGLRDTEDDNQWRRRRHKQAKYQQEDVTIRPTNLSIRVPIALKDLAAEMKLKASQLIAKLFVQGVIVTLNDLLADHTTIQLLGHEFGCDIQIDTSEEQRIRITDKSIREEVDAANPENLIIRPPVVAFMGHVDHGKTSLIDAIRKSNRAAGEAGAITQHIGAFRCSTPVGDIAILDTPGHEAFSAMRARGADVTDIVVLVVAGDEGMRVQTIEAMNHAKEAKVTIVVAINKCDKPNFNADNVYRQLSEQDLLPEVWGGQTITVNCSAVTGEGIRQLLEMLALQAEILELRADPTTRARGAVLESEMHKGMGSVATLLVQNGTLRCGDSLVFGQEWGKVKTMRDEFNKEILEAGPSTPVAITGLSGLPEAGDDFVVVKNEKEARTIAEARRLDIRHTNLSMTKKISMDNIFQQAATTSKKVLNIVLRADVQGSLEAMKSALLKIQSTKAELNIIFAGVGEVSESDVQLAATSKAVILGFHSQIESHADALLKQLGVQVKLHSIIYHAVDDVKVLMAGLLDKIAQETEKGKAEIKALFQSSQLGTILGCIVTEGAIHRNNAIRVKRGNDVVWKGTISSLKRVKEDVREVVKGLECGIVLNNCNEAKEGDILEAYEITYITQEL